MDRETIKKSQAKTISTALFPHMNYIFRLRKRMEEVGFPHDDKLYLLLCNAYDAMHRLSVEIHYLSCDGGYASRKFRLHQQIYLRRPAVPAYNFLVLA